MLVKGDQGFFLFLHLKGKSSSGAISALIGTFWREKAKPLAVRNTCSHFAKARTKSDEV